MKINYSQSNLQTFLDCQRKFELKYLRRQIWPAIQTEPILLIEEHIKNGNQFHLMAQQFFTGLQPDVILSQTNNQILQDWWISFLKFAHQFENHHCQPEVFISSNLKTRRFVGIFDLLVFSPGEKYYIIDWKTNNHKPGRSILEKHIQTRLYPLLLTLAGDQWNNNKKIEPHQIEMIYWFTNDPENPESFLYSQQQVEEDLEFFHHLVEIIEKTKPNEFQLTENEKMCKFCQYRSLCNRGIKPGSIQEEGAVDLDLFAEEIIDLDIEQIGEISI